MHMKNNAATKGIYIDHIDGYRDHVHCLVSLGPQQKIAEVVQLLKGESALWINKQQLTAEKFEWQSDYFVVSVSDSVVTSVRYYIRRQEEHHRRKSFEEEYVILIERYDFAAMEKQT